MIQLSKTGLNLCIPCEGFHCSVNPLIALTTARHDLEGFHQQVLVFSGRKSIPATQRKKHRNLKLRGTQPTDEVPGLLWFTSSSSVSPLLSKELIFNKRQHLRIARRILQHSLPRRQLEHSEIDRVCKRLMNSL